MAEKKLLCCSDRKRSLVEWGHPEISIRRQCELLGLNRSTLYSPRASGVSNQDLELMRLIDKQYLKTPFYGSRRMMAYLHKLDWQVGRKRVQRLMRIMGLEAIYPRPRTTIADKHHKVYPYLLRGLTIDRPNQVWCSDITYLPMRRGFMYLVAVMDWFSRYVLSWRLSSTMDTEFCLNSLEDALRIATPEIFNSDQGSQYTSKEFTAWLERAGIRISMDGKGRALDNIFIERLWRSVKYEHVYLSSPDSAIELHRGLKAYFAFYNEERSHQALEYRYPAEVYGLTSAAPRSMSA